MSNVDNPDGVIGINWRRNTKIGSIHYEARGVGPKYKRLYEWLNKSSYRCTGTDWPWDFFVFDDPKDHDRLIAEFGDDVREYNLEDEENE